METEAHRLAIRLREFADRLLRPEGVRITDDLKMAVAALCGVPLPRPPGHYSPQEVLMATAAVMKVDAALVQSKLRTQHVAFVRQLAMYLCREITDKSFPCIGETFDRDHSTVIHAYNLIARKAANGSAQLIASVRRQVEIYLEAQDRARQELHEADGGRADGISSSAGEPNGAIANAGRSATMASLGADGVPAAGAYPHTSPSLTGQLLGLHNGLLQPKPTPMRGSGRPDPRKAAGARPAPGQSFGSIWYPNRAAEQPRS